MTILTSSATPALLHLQYAPCIGLRKPWRPPAALCQAATQNRLLEASIDERRSSPFDIPSLYNDPDSITTAHEALEALISGLNVNRLSERELSLRKTLRDRRETVQELLMEAFKGEKISPTFCKDVLRSMQEFVDHIMIEAAALRKNSQYVNAPFSYRVRIYIEQNKVAKTVRWLKHNRFPASKIGKLLYMVEDHEGNLQPKINWFRSINIRGKDLSIVLTREPQILETRIAELCERVEILQVNGLRSDWVGWVVRRSPRVLVCSKEELHERIHFYTKLGITGDDFGKMLYNFPACLGRFPLEEMYGKLNYLRSFGLDDENLGRVLACKPQLIACDIEEAWKPLVKLLYYLGVDGYGLRKILIIQPSVFCLNLTENIAPKVRFLRDVGVHEETIGDVLVKYPPLLTFSLDNKIRPLVIFLLETAGVPIEKVGKVLYLQPDLVGCSLKNKLEVIAKFFLFHGFQKEDLGSMIADFPTLLKYSLSTLKPKLRYTLKEMKLQLKEIVDFPRLFSYSLESRIAPRHKTLVERGLNLSLRAMLACTDDEFMLKLDELV